VGKPQKIKGIGFSLLSLGISTLKSTKANDASFVRMQFQTESPETLSHGQIDTPGILCKAGHTDKIVRIPYHST
jgi:hypothetical protein